MWQQNSLLTRATGSMERRINGARRDYSPDHRPADWVSDSGFRSASSGPRPAHPSFENRNLVQRFLKRIGAAPGGHENEQHADQLTHVHNLDAAFDRFRRV
jgi:hypothetical protein